MRINRTSWHYRLWSFYSSKEIKARGPVNLCRYFWRITLLTLLLVGLALELGVFFWFIVLRHLLEVLMFCGGLALIVGAVFLCGQAIVWLSDRPRKVKQPGLIRSYLKAKKQRYCPMIEVVDG